MPKDLLRLGPSPAGRETLPGLAGIGAGLLAAVVGIVIEAAGARNGMKPGAVLDWLPLLAAALFAAGVLLTRGKRREALLAATVTALALFTAVHPKPEPWMYVYPLLGVAIALGVEMAPGTRMVTAIPALLGTLVLLEIVGRQAPSTAIVFLVGGAFLAALWFLVPQDSGWRRVPFLVLLAVGLVVPVAFAVVVLASLATIGISTPRSWSGFSGGPDLGTLLAVALVVAYPYGVWRLWIHPKARAFVLPTLQVPRLRSREPSAEPVGRNA